MRLLSTIAGSVTGPDLTLITHHMLETATSPATGLRGRRIVGPLLGVAVHLALTAWLIVPGHLSIDEGTYHAMVAALDRGEGVTLDNGYEQLASPELVFVSATPYEEHLAPLPPPLYPVVALPFYRMAGWVGSFWLNALAFLGVAALTGWIASVLFPKERIAVLSVGVLCLAGFTWNYSQAAWPHMLATLAALGSWCLALRAGRSQPRGWVPAALAGLVAGVGVGVRLDVVFILPAVALVLVAGARARRVSWLGQVCALGLGLVPPLLVISWINAIKFGQFTPFSYGGEGAESTSGLTHYVGFFAFAAGVLAVVWALWRLRTAAVVSPSRRLAVVAAVVLVVALCAAVPSIREMTVRLAQGAVELVVDLRFRDPSLQEPALSRSEGGALIYGGGIKKSLLQSCPYLVACLVPLAAGPRRSSAFLLAAPPALYVGVYSYFAWHGGMCLNLRYLLPILPFTAILSALAWRALMGRAAASGEPRVGGRVLLGGGAVSIGLFLGLTWLLPTLGGHEFVLLTVPLVLAACLTVLLVASGTMRSEGLPWRRVAGFVLAMAWAWSAVVAFGYDLPWERERRARNLAVGQAIDPLIAEEAMLTVSYPDPFFHFIDQPKVRIVVATRDSFHDFRRLALHHFQRRIPVYAAMEREVWEAVRAIGFLEGLRVEPLWTDGRFFLASLEPSAPRSGESTPPRGPASPQGVGSGR